MSEFMLITTWPLYSSKSFHKNYAEVEDRLDQIFTLTEEYYKNMGQEFTYLPNEFSGYYPGIFLYRITPENVHSQKLIGTPKVLKKPEQPIEYRYLNGLDSDHGAIA